MDNQKMNNNRPDPDSEGGNNKKDDMNKKSLMVMVVLAVIVMIVAQMLSGKITSASQKEVTYTEFMQDVKDGKVTGLFRNVASTESGYVIVSTSPSAADFYPLTGNELGYTIRKNGSTISMSEVKPYDVATYDPISKVITLCDVRLSCVYENAAPSPSAPATVTACGGNTFTVMANAMDSIAQYKLGQNFTLLFTADGQVAGAVAGNVWGGGIWGTGTNITGNAMGVVSGDTIKLIGTNVTLKVDAENAEKYAGQLVTVSSYTRGVMALNPLNLSYAAGNFEKSSMRLGSLFVSDSVKVFDRGYINGEVVIQEVALSSLPTTVPAASISGYHKDASGRVDIIILNNFTGDLISADDYGWIESTSHVSGKGKEPYTEVKDGEEVTYYDAYGYKVDENGYYLDDDGNMMARTIYQLKFINNSGVKTYDTLNNIVVPSGFGTISLISKDGNEFAVVQSMLSSIGKANSSDFYTMNGVTYVRVNNKTYEVADGVICYNPQAGSWFPSLTDARIYSTTLLLYADSSANGKIRAVSTPAQ